METRVCRHPETKVLVNITRYSPEKDQKRLTTKGLLHTYSITLYKCILKNKPHQESSIVILLLLSISNILEYPSVA